MMVEELECVTEDVETWAPDFSCPGVFGFFPHVPARPLPKASGRSVSMRTYAARRTDEEVVGLTFGTYRVIARGPRVHNHFSLVVVCDTERGGCGREATVEQRRLSDGKKCLCQLPCTVCGGKRDIIRKDLKRDSLCKACKAKHGRKERRDCKGS